MKLLYGNQIGSVEDPVGAKFAMVGPVLKATLYSLARDRIERLGGIEAVTLHDLSREILEGHGDAGICFEYAVHEAVGSENPLIHEILSDALERTCKIKGGAESILFGPEKEGVIPILESFQNALTSDSVVYVGNRGRPPKLRNYIWKIVNAYRRNEERNKLPRSIRGLWKADLFLGNATTDAWVGTTIKINPSQLQSAQGLRLAIYPKRNDKDVPRKDEKLNLIRAPLPYDGHFMEVFYKAFYLTRAFLRADASVPKPVDLPDAEDRLITSELQKRRQFPVVDLLDTLISMSQQGLVVTADVEERTPDAALSEHGGLQQSLRIDRDNDSVSITPIPFVE